MKLAHITDFHFDDFLSQRFSLNTWANFEAILADISSQGLDRLVLTGDFGVPENYSRLAARLMALGIPCNIILGNHDVGEDKRAALLTSGLLLKSHLSGGEYYYSQDIAGTRTLFLDTSRGETSPAQKQWLHAELRGASGGRAVIFAHHPLLDCGTAMDKTMAQRDRDEVAEILFQSGKSIELFCGHYHFTHETTTRNIRQFVTPACIMQIRGEGESILSDSFDFGYRVIELTPQGTKTETRMFVSPRKVMPGE